MPDVHETCPECGVVLPVDAVRGVCPRCLVRRGLESLPPEDPGDTIHLVLPEEAAGLPLPLLELGDYELLAGIGRGGMGVIYKARQRSLDRIVALKLIRSGTLARPEDIARFRTEAAAAARLRHPHIVAIHEIGGYRGQHFYSMDLVPGRSLADAVRAGPLPPSRAARCVQTVARAIQYAHERGVLHRDLKPSNILLDAEDEPHVADFGLAKLLQSDSELTLTGAVLGSPNYMPPEQARGKHAEVSARSDVYALGAILYECLTGRPPFTAATPLETMKLVVEQDPVSPRALNPTLPRDLETICLKCLAKEPVHRYPTAQELADELGRFLADEPIHGRPAGFAERAVRWCRRKPAMAALLGLGFAAPLGFVGLLLAKNAEVRHQAERALAQEKLATNALVRAESSEFVARQNAYASDMHLAHLAYESGDVATARHLIEALRPQAGHADLRGFEWRLLWQQCQGDQLSIWRGHTGAVHAVAYSPDGRVIASGSADRTVRLWAADSGELRKTLDGHPDGVATLSFSSDGQFLAAGLADGMVKVWDLRQDRIVWSFAGKTPVRGQFSRSGHWLGLHRTSTPRARHGTVVVLDWHTRQEVFSLHNGGDFEDFSPDGRSVIVTTNDTWAVIIEVATGRVVHQSTNANALFMVSSPDGERVAAVSGPQKYLRFWQPGTGAIIPLPERHSGGIKSVAFSPNGTRFVTASDDATLRLWDAEQRTELGCLRGHAGGVLAAAYAPDGRCLASASRDGSVRLWSAEPPSPLILSSGIPYRYQCSADGRVISGQRQNGDIFLWTANDPRRVVVVTNSIGVVRHPFFVTGDGKFLITRITASNMPYGLEYWEVSTRQWLRTVALRDSVKGDVSWAAATDQQVVCHMDDRRITRFWNTETGDLLGTVPERPPPGHGVQISFSPNGGLLAMNQPGIWTNGLTLWEVPSGRLRRRLPLPCGMNGVAFSPAGNLVAGGGSDQRVHLWNLVTGEALPPLAGLQQPGGALAFSPDGRTLAASDQGGAIRLWNLSTRRLVATVQQQSEKPSYLLTFSSSGDALISVDWGGNVLRWRAPGFAETDASE